MRTTVDIPDPIYRELKIRAAERGCSVKEIVLNGIKSALTGNGKKSRKVTLPLIHSKKPGRLKLTNEQIDDILFS